MKAVLNRPQVRPLRLRQGLAFLPGLGDVPPPTFMHSAYLLRLLCVRNAVSMEHAPGLAMLSILVEINFGDLIGSSMPVVLGHLISNPPVRKEMRHLEEILLFLPLWFRFRH